jgi:NDP-sugar pyrophosphorylase family protein
MKAMILAAGLGTRLRPLTSDRPKALVEVAGRTLLEITLSRLKHFGVREVIINVHHFGDMVTEFLKAHENFGLHIEISREDVLLDTGGGLKKATWFFLQDGRDSAEPLLLHNVDIISTIDLGHVLQAHRDAGALATLAVQDRVTSRYLLFNDANELCGRRAGRGQPDEIVRSSAALHARAFAGIHVISPQLLTMLTEDGIFSIITSYLRLAAAGEKIQGFAADKYYWRDLGKPDQVVQADADYSQGLFQ